MKLRESLCVIGLLSGLVTVGCEQDVGVVRNKNRDPVATIHTPTDQSSFTEGDLIDFVGTVSDEDGFDTLTTVTWTSSIDFELGSQELVAPDEEGFSRFRAVLSVGSHVISLVATDEVGAVGQDSLTVLVLSANQEPIVSILSPENFTQIVQGDSVSFVGLVADEQDGVTDLAIEWSAEDAETGEFTVLSEDGANNAGAASTIWTPEKVGDYVISLRATDLDGNQGLAQLYLVVNDPDLLDLDGDGWYATAGDCDDTDPLTYPHAPEVCGDVKDNDCNGLIDDKDVDRDGHIDEACVNFSGDWPVDDCDDLDGDVYPGAPELPDGRDNTCEGDIDEGTAHYDNDGDCFCTAWPCTGSVNAACASVIDGDCDDTEPAVNPDATEVCNGIDDDCDADIDDADTDLDTSTGLEWYVDGDIDGYGAVSVWACLQPSGTALVGGDCDDTKTSINPGASELCNTVDDDCDGTVDEDDAVDAKTWYLDADGDTYGLLSVQQVACSAPATYVADSTDCDDLDASIYPGATEVCNGVDDDCDTLTDDDDPGVDLTTGTTYFEDDDVDGFGDATDTKVACDTPMGYVLDDSDCDDTRKSVYPGADEYCNTRDDDCDGVIDEDSAVDVKTFYLDADKDGYGGTSLKKDACRAPIGYVATSTDCDDLVRAVNPGAVEVCNGLDDDCDTRIDDADSSLDSTTTSSWYYDGDGDTYGTSSSSKQACLAPVDHVADDTDCDDSQSSIHPGAAEVCNSVDDDCDGDTDDDDSGLDVSTGRLFYKDGDADTYGSGAAATMACSMPTGYVTNANDCDDSKFGVNPSATEACNTYDDDCDGVVDEDGATGATAHYADWDGDTYGDAKVKRLSCSPPSGYVTNSTDCDDGEALVYPGATEICNEVDDDCDGDVDDDDSSVAASSMSTFYLDDDRDGYGVATTTKMACSVPAGYAVNDDDCDDIRVSVNPGATEKCNTIDDDCDTQVDEPDAVDAKTFYADVDGDGYGNASLTARYCTQPTGYSTNDTDCNDLKSAIHPGATEVCNGIDDDCDTYIDDADTSLDLSSRYIWYADTDSDGYGGTTILATACVSTSGGTRVTGDCDDSNASRNPGASEVCNSIDDDCDALVDDLDASLDKTTGSVFYADDDGDTYGSASDATMSCVIQSGYVTDARDCDDSNSAVNPAATEICDDGLDNDCDGSANTCRLVGDYTMNSDADVYLDGSNAADYAGQAVANLGDWDNDGYDEVLVAAPFYDDGSADTNAGIVYVLDGNETSSLDLDTDAIATIVGEDKDDFAGWGLDGGGDFDGDGTADILLGAHNAETATTSSNSGMVYFFSGTVSGPNSASSADVTFLGGQVNGLLGRDVAFVGDLDNDGDDELALAAPYYKANAQTYSGRVYIIDGSSTLSGNQNVATAASTIIEGEKRNAKLGYSEYSNALDGAGDVDGDGNQDFLVGSFGYDSAGATTVAKAGRAYLFYGDLTTGTISAGSADVIVTGQNTTEYVGYSVAGVGDVDADGYADIVIGADGLSSGTGAALLIYGGSSVSSSWNSTNADVILYGDDTGEHAGRSVAGAGDSDSDGKADFLVGAPFNSKKITDGGVAYVVFDTAASTVYLGSDVNVGRFYGDAAQSYAGYALSTAGDYNGDGNADLLFGMGRYGSSAGSLAGRAYIYTGLGL